MWIWALKLIGMGSGTIGPLMNIIKKYWKIIVIALFIAGFVWKYWSLSNENQELNISLVTASTTIEAYVKAEEEYQSLISEQNDSIQKLKEESEASKKRLSDALVKARKRVAKLDREITALSQSKPKNESCEATVDWMIERQEDLKW